MAKPRIAVFSPAPPVPSGISDYNAELLPRLSGELEIDLFLDGYLSDSIELNEAVCCWQASRFDEINRGKPYDLAVYHLGNSPHHNYILPRLYRHPGLAVLHDHSLHDTRLRAALESWRGEDYRAEMEVAYGERGGAAAELALAGLGSPYLMRTFTLSELAVRASVATAVHEEWLAERIREAVPGAEVRSLPLGMEIAAIDPTRVKRARAERGIAADAFLVGTFGLLTPDKGIETLLDAFAWLLRRRPDSRLLLAGGVGENLPLEKLIGGRGLGDAVVATGRVPMAEFASLMAACDAAVFLRWPTRRETSAAALRAMAAGTATVVSDLAHLRDLPGDAVLRVPLVGEQRALRQVLLRLAESRPLRERLGRAAADYVVARHSWGNVAPLWLELIGRAAELASSAHIDHSFLPAHLRG